MGRAFDMIVTLLGAFVVLLALLVLVPLFTAMLCVWATWAALTTALRVANGPRGLRP